MEPESTHVTLWERTDAGWNKAELVEPTDQIPVLGHQIRVADLYARTVT